MIKVIAVKGTEIIEKKYTMYWQALTVAINLQNIGYTVEIER